MNNDNTQLPAEVVEKILRARDALIVGDTDEAYHQLYGIPHPDYDTYYPWQDMERQINYPILFEKAINDRRQVTEYATKLHQLGDHYQVLKISYDAALEKANDAHAILEKIISRPEAGLLPDRFIYQEIKTFLDGTK